MVTKGMHDTIAVGGKEKNIEKLQCSYYAYEQGLAGK